MNNPSKEDSLYNNLPFMIHLIEVVHQCIHENTIFSPDFSQQVYCYGYLFLLLGFILPTKQGNLYIQLLDKTIGLEQYFMCTVCYC